MFRKFAYVLVLLVILTSAIVFVQPTHAQGNCTSAIIDDETGTLNVGAICEAAKQWSDKGVTLYVLYSQQSFNSEDAWYGYLDQKEIGIGQRQGDQVKKNFLAFEATVDGQWTAITQGDYVYYNTPFDGQVDRLKGVLGNGITGGNATQAFVDTLNEGYTIAFPAPAPQQQQAEQPPVVVIITPQPTREPVDWTPVTNGVKTVFVWLLIFGGGFALIYFVVIPGWKTGSELYRKYQHLSTIKTRTTKLLNGLGRLFEGNEAESMLLFQLLKGYGIEKYPKANKEVQEWLRRSKAALSEGFRLWKLLESDKGKKQSTDQQIKAWETLYLTLVGSNPDILALTDQQIAQLLDPSTGVETTSDDVQLVEQVRTIAKELAGGGYKIAFMLVKPASVDQEGILGYVKQVKDQLTELRQAKAQAAPKVDQAKEAREKAGSGPFPGKLTANQVYSKADSLIAEAEQNIANQLWLPAIRQATDAMELIQVGQQTLPKISQAEQALNNAMAKFEGSDLLPEKSKLFGYPRNILTASLREMVENDYVQATDYAEDLLEALQSLTIIIAALLSAYATHQSQLEKVDAVAKKGFKLSFYQKLTGEVADDAQKAGENLVKGDYQQADAMVRELTRDSESLLVQAQALETLYNQNLAELKRLSVEVARVSKYNESKATPSWESLCGYPQGNRAGVVDVETPTRTLQELFDDPTRADDLASKIAQLNSLEKQQFGKAQEELVTAFARMQEAESQLKAIVERLKDVESAERDSSKTLGQVRKELETSMTKRDEYDEYVDEAVDRQIEEASKDISQIEKLIERREYLEAMRMLLQARTTINAALSSINEQAQHVLGLLKELEPSQATASKTVNQVARDYANLIPVLKSSVAGASVEKAVHALRRAENANGKLAGLEDHELESAAENTLALYQEALESAQEASRRMGQDKNEYDRYHSGAQRAVSSASQAIASARSTMSDSDAGSAGDSAYRRAQQYLPGSPSYGASVSQLQQIERQAEQARQAAQQAQSEAQSHIDAVEAERARRRREEEARRRREEEERRRRESYSSSSSSFGSSHSSSSFGSSSRSSSFGSSHSSSSFGSSNRSSSSSFGGSHRR